MVVNEYTVHARDTIGRHIGTGVGPTTVRQDVITMETDSKCIDCRACARAWPLVGSGGESAFVIPCAIAGMLSRRRSNLTPLAAIII